MIFRFGWSLDRPDHTKFGGADTVPAIQLSVSSSSTVGRDSSAAIGGGEWRGARPGDVSVLYRVVAELTATVRTSVGAARGEEHVEDAVLYVRVPLREGPRFEAMVGQVFAAEDFHQETVQHIAYRPQRMKPQAQVARIGVK